MSAPLPPRIATWLLRVAATDEDRRFVLDDLREEFETIARESGDRAARRRYWRQALTSAAPLAAVRIRQLQPARVMRSLRHSVRVLRASPGATVVAIVTLALGIGANTAVFSVVDAVLLRPLPYAAPDRLVSAWQVRDGARAVIGAADYAEYAAGSDAFEALGAFMATTRVLAAGTVPEEVNGDVVSQNLFGLLGAHAAVGRTFAAQDARPGADRTLILSDAAWRTRFGADPAVIGRSVLLSGQPHIVIGVMRGDFEAPSRFFSTVQASFFLCAPASSATAPRGDRDLRVIGRLRAGVSVLQAQDALGRIDARLAAEFPDTNRDVRARLAPLAADVTQGVRVSLLVILACVGLVVLIAAINVANLLIVKALGQRREVAIRLALGAGRSDILVEYLVRGLTLSTAGAVCGLACGVWTRDLLAAAAPPSIPRLDHLTLSARILAMTLVVTVVSGVVAGLLPALQVLREGRTSNLKVAEQSSSGTRTARRWQGLLLATEIAAAIVVALGAGLLVKSVLLLNRVDLGFQTDRVLTFQLRAPDTRSDPAARLAFFRLVSERVARIPGVRGVAFANNFPMRGGWSGGLQVLAPSGPVDAEADFQAVSETYFATLGVPVIRGRAFTGSDRSDSPPVVIVSQALVDRFLPGVEPIGVAIRRRPGAPALTIVGVVGDIRRDGKFAAVTPQVFFAAAQTASYPVALEAMAVRAERENPRALLPSIREAIAGVNPAQSIANIRALDELLSASVASWRFNMLLLTSFAALALALALVGVYGVVAHSAAERTREIGIRAALGATKASIVRLVVGGALAWAIPGIVAGLAAAVVLARVMASMLFSVPPADVPTFAIVTALMTAAATMASYLPARRAAAADPLRALRMD